MSASWPEGIDVLLTDWMMPGVDGPELCRRVRHELSDRYIYIVLITVLGNREQILEGMSAGADDYLTKPVEPFAVRTRLVAAERVTALHGQLISIQSQLEEANLKLLGLSLTDALTGLGNRRRMEEDLARAHARATRVRRSYSMTLLDIDHFKLFNDHYGHQAGDEALRQIGRCLGRVIRADESVYRYGGEEFLVLMPDSTASDAAVAGERIRHAVTDMGIHHDYRPTAPPLVTLSGGVSCWIPGSTVSASEVLFQADEALFQAKSKGRNRLQVAPAHDNSGAARVSVGH
jgi:diguanylate cyclase (GGDEF)-like protein